MFQHNNPELYTSIFYHMSWPGSDPFYTYNSEDGNARRAHYGFSWVPYIVVNGGAHETLNETQNVATWTAEITDQGNIVSPLGLSIDGNIDYLGMSSCEVTLTPEAGITGTYILQVVLVEDDAYFMGSNGYPNHHNIMRKMFPDAGGTQIELVEGVTSTETVSMEIPLDIELGNCRLVVFVEDASQAVLNAATIGLTDITPVNIPHLSASTGSIEVIDLNGDGKLNPGESTNYSVTLENRCGFIEATGITGYLSSSSQFVTITDSVGQYSSIAPCISASNEVDKFSFTVSADAPRVNEIEFNLRITANQDGEAPYETNETVYVTMDMYQVHFPVEIDHGVVSGSAVLDIDGDGDREIVFGGMDSLLHVLTSEGIEETGFPFVTDSKITSAPAIGDVDNDGDYEIVVASVSGGIYVVETNGSGSLIAQAEDNILATPAIDDLDGDGDLEIVTAGFGFDLVVIHHDGTALEGFPIIIDGERMEGAAAIADIDGDGSKDIIVGTKGDYMHVFDVNGNLLPGFPVDLGRDIKTAPVITDLTGDGSLEIISGQRSGVVYALSNTGTVLWTHQLAAVPILVPPAVFDANQDGLMETVYVLPDGRVSVLDHDGNMLDGWPQSLSTTCYSAPILADIFSDGLPEIILGDDANDLYAFELDGTLVPDFPMVLDSRIHCAATIEDLDQDGNLEIIVGTDGGMSAIDIPTESQVGPYWNTSRGNYQRTGYYANPIFSSIEGSELPKELTLEQNYPNPFNPNTTIEFGIPALGKANLTIFDVNGKQVRTLIDAELTPGNYSLLWNGEDLSGNSVAAGLYFARISTSTGEQVMKMTLIK